jgi:glycosyltransferase involved in cell wall biosynthesis
MTARKTRIAVINTHPIQYFAPLYAYLSASPDIEVTALYLSDFSLRGAKDKGFGQVVKWDIDLLSGYPNRYVGRHWNTIEPFGFRASFVPEVWGEVRRGNFDALWVNGHVATANFVGMGAARSLGIPVFMRCETHLGLPTSAAKTALRRPVLSRLYRQCDGCLAIGTANRDFYRAMGVPDSKISLVPYAIDNARFIRDARIEPEERAAIRRKYNISENRPAVLYVSKLQQRKFPGDLVYAGQRLASDGLEFDLVIAGSGEMLSVLEEMAAQGGPPHIVFPGFINQSEMPKLLGACDVFVLPATAEPWGIIVNEAMCAGLPIVLSNEIGCVPDLLREGENGFSFKSRDIDALARALRHLLLDQDLRRSMSRRSLEIIRDWGYERCLAGVLEAVEKVGLIESTKFRNMPRQQLG